jgi:hypothetical protein
MGPPLGRLTVGAAARSRYGRRATRKPSRLVGKSSAIAHAKATPGPGRRADQPEDRGLAPQTSPEDGRKGQAESVAAIVESGWRERPLSIGPSVVLGRETLGCRRDWPDRRSPSASCSAINPAHQFQGTWLSRALGERRRRWRGKGMRPFYHGRSFVDVPSSAGDPACAGAVRRLPLAFGFLGCRQLRHARPAARFT